tara:strand:+ start:145 stop:519 length:375 start_codon:yes stop_codon:yes gene_type:complete
MKYIYPKKINIEDIVVIQLKDKYIIKNNNKINVYGIIIKLEDCEIIKEYNKYKILLNNDELIKYETFLSNNINNYKKISQNNQIEIITSDKIKQYYEEKRKGIYLNIHYVKKTGFLNIPKISIL